MRSIGRFTMVLVVGLVSGAIGALYVVSNPPTLPGGLALPLYAPSIQAAPPNAPAAAPAVGRTPAQAQAPTIARNQQIDDIVIDVYERVSPSVVNITFSSQVRDVFGRLQNQEGTGSGFILDNRGHIATNHHVAGGATRLDITLADGNSYVGEMVGADEANDLAIVRLAAPDEVLQRLTVASLGDADQLRVGQTVVAIGNPFGLERSASMGIVSSLGRTRPGESQRLISNMIQTDAAINPGNSGGPLLNLAGEVVGINEQIQTSVQGNIGIGFAVPVNALKRFLPDMLAGRTPRHAWLGISGSRLSPTLAEQLNLPIRQGVVVVQALPNGPAAKGGLQGSSINNRAAADIITDIDGTPMRMVEDIVRYIDQRSPGDTVRVTFLRATRSQSTEVVLGVWPTTGAPLG